MVKECFISVDVESSGPIPGTYSLLSIGACLVENNEKNFYAELKPINKAFDPKALEVSGFDLQKLEAEGLHPEAAMKKFQNWIEDVTQDAKPVFVGFNGCYDWQFVNWYFHTYLSLNPFGFGGIDIKSYYMGLKGLPWFETTSSKLPDEFQPETEQNHNALDDAIAQASIFRKMLGVFRS